MKKRTIAFLLSDYMMKDYEDAIKVAGKKHDIIGVQIYDPRERAMPDIGLIRVYDAESNRVLWMDTSRESVRNHYSQHYNENMEYFNKTFLKSGSDTISISTDDSYINALLKFFKKRGNKR